MVVARSAFHCEHCGAIAPRWAGRCASCGAWNALREVPVAINRRAFGSTLRAPEAPSARAVSLGSIDPESDAPVPSGIGELDRILSGGLVPGSMSLLGGEPGIGKSTLALQIAAAAVARGGSALIVSAEESAGQVRRRAERLAGPIGQIAMCATNSLEAALFAAEETAASLLIVDSIQTIADPETAGSAGSVTQVRACAAAFVAYAKSRRVSCILIGHVTKDGALAGPKVLEHLVDTVLSFEGDRHHFARVLSVQKHRFGPAGELAIFEMREDGLFGIADPSAFLLADRHVKTSGSVVVPVIEGVRPLLVELQSLVVRSVLSTPRRVVQGITPGRLALVAAVLERRAGMHLVSSDIFASVVGGVRVSEPATDLGLGLCIASSVSGVALGEDLVALGEIGLGGELRAVRHSGRRLEEAARHGFRRAVVPSSAPDGPPGITLLRVATVSEAFDRLGLSARGVRPASPSEVPLAIGS